MDRGDKRAHVRRYAGNSSHGCLSWETGPWIQSDRGALAVRGRDRKQHNHKCTGAQGRALRRDAAGQTFRPRASEILCTNSADHRLNSPLYSTASRRVIAYMNSVYDTLASW